MYRFGCLTHERRVVFAMQKGGIGEKTAKKLISEFGSIEGLLAHTDQLKGKQKESVEANRDQALLSKKLVTIMTDAPVTVGFDEIAMSPRNDEALKSLDERIAETAEWYEAEGWLPKPGLLARMWA